MKALVTIGFRVTKEEEDDKGMGTGVWKEEITTRQFKADVTKNYSRNNNGEGINDDFILSNNISIICHPDMLSDFTSIIYCELRKVKWKVSSIDASQYPRLILSTGGVYNESNSDEE